jgi:hypothetical protein
MHVIRHEENTDACPITCNGEFNASWSKTMIGFEKEDKAYSLEVTYNYGISKYEAGSGLQEIEIAVTNPIGAARQAKALGYAVNGKLITGPDNYMYRVAALPGKRKERFLSVSLNVKSVGEAALWYTQFLGMQALDMRRRPSGFGHDQWTIGYTHNAALDQPHLILTQTSEEEGAPTLTQWEGRHAISLPEVDMRLAYARIEHDMPHLVVHPIRELDEALGVLVIAIVKDLDGYEICLVSSETFDKAVNEAADFVGPDWEKRSALLTERTLAAATAGKPFGVATAKAVPSAATKGNEQAEEEDAAPKPSKKRRPKNNAPRASYAAEERRKQQERALDERQERQEDQEQARKEWEAKHIKSTKSEL